MGVTTAPSVPGLWGGAALVRLAALWGKMGSPTRKPPRTAGGQMANFGHETFIIQSKFDDLLESIKQFDLKVSKSSLTGHETEDYDPHTGDEISGPELSVTVIGSKKSLLNWITHEARQISGGAQSVPSHEEFEELIFAL
jgi:hypothetical protein